MEREIVKSSNIASIGYDEEKEILEIEFNSGGIYQYLEVPDSVHKDLMGAASVGKYFNQNIQPNYKTKQLK